jgi:putative hydrolase of HD superfamily
VSNKDLNFIYEIGALRHIDRQWKRFLIYPPQNTVEHTFRVMWLAQTIAKMEKADTDKVLKMALVHDIVESRTGDTDYLMRTYVKRDDEKAIGDILKGTSLEKEYLKIFDEYEKRDSLEAKIVKDADTLDIDLEVREQESRGMKTIKPWQKFRFEGNYKKLFTKSARKIWREIQNSNPTDWHTKADHRFKKRLENKS